MKIELNTAQLNLIAVALSRLPYCEVAELIANVDAQIKAAMQANQADGKKGRKE
jgi:hypothetical protein